MQEMIRQTGLTPPYVSVILPIYNAAGFMRSTLDSLLTQTLAEIEIIPVDDCSTDDSRTVLAEYAAQYPGKVVPQAHAVNQGPSPARWTGVQHARAPYIMFLDSDDLLDPRACELALTEALRGGHDLVGLTSARRNQWGELSVLQHQPRTLTNAGLIRDGLAAFWSYLYDRRLLLDESIFLPMYFEDAAANPRVFAKAQSIGWVAEPNLYHYVQREGSIMSSFLSGTRRMDLFRGDEELWQRADTAYLPDFACRIAKRMAGNHRKYPELCTNSVRHIQSMYPRLKPHLNADCPPETIAALDALMALPAQPPVPAVVYLDGFAGTADQIAAQQNFAVQWETVYLDETNCLLGDAPAYIREALTNGRHEVAAAWFAMQRIEQTGGFYLAPGYSLLPVVESLRYEDVCLCAGTDRTLSLHFFGGAPGQAWWQRLLACDTEAGLSVLLREAGLRLTGEEERTDCLHVLPAILCSLRLRESFCCAALPGDMHRVVADHIARISETQRVREMEQRRLKIYVADLTRQKDELRTQRDHFRQSRDQLRLELANAHARSLRGRISCIKQRILGKK